MTLSHLTSPKSIFIIFTLVCIATSIFLMFYRLSQNTFLSTLVSITYSFCPVMILFNLGIAFIFMLKCHDLAYSNTYLYMLFFIVMIFCFYYAYSYILQISKHLKYITNKNIQLIETQQHIHKLAYTHPNTALKNAHKLQEDLKDSSYEITGACMLTIRNFKLLLTLIGYKESYAVLVDITKALISHFNTDEYIYQLSSDRFIILYKEDVKDFEIFVQNILTVFCKQNLCTIDLNPCIAATLIHNQHFDYETIIQELEMTYHVAKTTPSHYALFKSDMTLTLQTDLELEAKLKEATENNLWDVYFQPKIDVTNNQITGAEALIRWRGEENTITPNIFIPLAEKLGLINQIGRYVIETTFKYVSELSAEGFSNLRFSINLSVAQLMELELVDFITNTYQKYHIIPECIIFEVTESILIHNMAKAGATITQLKALGFKFSLDDFGTGYSSLAYLSKLNFDELKFDREFIRNIQSDEKNLIILEHVTKMGKKLGLDIVTEGIEYEEQYHTIKNLGCSYYQGYYYSKPIPFNDFQNLLCPQ